MRVVQINGGVFGSTGRIMFGIANEAAKCGIETKCFSPVTISNRSQEPAYPYEKIGTFRSRQLNVLIDRITGYNGCSAFFSTLKLLHKVAKYEPDIIHLHNLHNSYINLPLLFRFIKKHEIPVVWTLHDCWSFTGHCPHFTTAKCNKWKTGCHHCVQYKEYPSSYVDRTKAMWKLKRKLFTSVKNMTIVTPSQWLADLVKDSFLSDYKTKVINNGIDLSIFNPTDSDFKDIYGIADKKIVLGVAFGWDDRKGYKDCLALADRLSEDYQVVLIGVSKQQISSLPSNILGIEKTNSQKELVEIYSAADVFINTTYEDNYPTVNLEARACGLPVITYKTGGSPESAGKDATVVDVGDVEGLKSAIEVVTGNKNHHSSDNISLSADARFSEYVELYLSANQ